MLVLKLHNKQLFLKVLLAFVGNRAAKSLIFECEQNVSGMYLDLSKIFLGKIHR